MNGSAPTFFLKKTAEASCAEPELSGASSVNEKFAPEPEESDIVMDYKEALDCIGRKKKDKDWILEGDMLAAFRQNPEPWALLESCLCSISEANWGWAVRKVRPFS
jgi:hypothetical protein